MKDTPVRDRIERITLLAAVLLAAILTTRGAGAQTSAAGPACNAATPSGTGTSTGLVAAENGFGFRLLRTLAARDPSANTFLSPTSVATALGVAYDGARGDTGAAMARTLGLSHLSQAKIRAQAAALLGSLRPTGGAGLVIADSLWAQQGTGFRSAFIKHARSSYGATVRRIDLRAASAPATINAWVSCATRGKIPSIVGPIPPQTILYLINAVYFRDSWAHPFSQALTKTGTFHAPGGAVQTPMMTQTSTFGYYQAPTFQMVSLPYAHPRFSMVVLLPRSGTSLPSVLNGITDRTWNRWLAQMKGQEGTLSLPRISLRTDYNLIPPLASLGMGNAFSESANFSGMCVQPCAISEVRHKALLQVDEKGTIAAGVTSVGVEPTAIQTSRFSMTVDRPFLIAITDRTTGAVLFAGAVNTPKG